MRGALTGIVVQSFVTLSEYTVFKKFTLEMVITSVGFAIFLYGIAAVVGFFVQKEK